jgi:hypothetical protein
MQACKIKDKAYANGDIKRQNFVNKLKKIPKTDKWLRAARGLSVLARSQPPTCTGVS